MCKSRIFSEYLKIISDETEVPPERILSSCKESDTVDARSILIMILLEKGLYPVQIASMINRTPANVRHVISTFEDRMRANKMLRFLYERVKSSTPMQRK